MNSRRSKRRKTTSKKNKGFQPLDRRGYLQISVPGLRYESRDIIKIYLGAGGCKYTQAFYRSSGSNTKQTGTFMPFDGIGLKRKSGSFVHEPFLEKTHVQSLRGFTDLSDEGSGDQLSPKKFFSRLGNCHLGLISFLLGGPAWENLDTYKHIYLEKCQTKLESEGVDVNYLISQTPIIRDNLQKYNRGFYNYNSKKAQAVNIPVDNIVRVINDFVGTDTTINNFNSCRFTDHEREHLGRRIIWPRYPDTHKKVDYRDTMMILGQGMQKLKKNIPKDPKKKEEQLARIRKRMEAMKKKGAKKGEKKKGEKRKRYEFRAKYQKRKKSRGGLGIKSGGLGVKKRGVVSRPINVSMGQLQMTNGYPSGISTYLDRDHSPGQSLMSRVEANRHFIGLDYQPEGSHDLCAVYAIMSCIGADQNYLKKGEGEWKNNARKALEWVRSLGIINIPILDELLNDTELFDYWYTLDANTVPRLQRKIPVIQHLINVLPNILADHFGITIHGSGGEVPQLQYHHDEDKLPTLDDISLAVRFNGDLDAAASYLSRIEDELSPNIILETLLMKHSSNASEKVFDKIMKLEKKSYNPQQRKTLILRRLRSINWGASEIQLRGNILHGLEGLYPVGSEASAVHYYCVRRVRNTGPRSYKKKYGLLRMGKKVKSKRKSKKKSRKNNVNNKKMKTHLDQKMLKELKLLQQEVSTINKHRISHLKSQHKRLEKRIVKGVPISYNKYKKNVNTRMKQRLKRVDKSLNVYEKATKKRSRKVSRKSSRKRRSVKRKASRKRRSVKRKVSRKRRSVKRKVSRKRRSVKRKVSRKRKSAKRKSRKRRSVKRKVSRKRKSVKRKSRKSSRKRRVVKKKR